MIATLNTELRKLRPAELYNLALILNLSDNWKKLMASVTKDDNDDAPKFSGECISIVEQAARQERKLAASIFLEEWATMGKKRPTVGLLLDLLMETELFRAADYLAQDVLKVSTPERPTSGPAAPVDIDGIASLLLRQNLNPLSDSSVSNYRTDSTAEIHLSQINYPSLVLDRKNGETNDDSLSEDNDVGFIEMEYAESRSNQVLGPARALVHPKSLDDCRNHSKASQNTISTKPRKEISDLMKFSSTDNHNSKQYSQSDLMKFDSEKINTNEEIATSEEFMPDLNLLCANSSSKRVTNVNHNFAIAEMTSAELPACLGNFGVSEEQSKIVDERFDRDNAYFHRELVSAELPVCINEKIIVDSNETNLSTNFCSDDDDSCSKYSSDFLSESMDDRLSESLEIEKNANPSIDIPCFVVDAEWTERNEDKQAVTKYETKRSALNSQEIPLTVLEFHKR